MAEEQTSTSSSMDTRRRKKRKWDQPAEPLVGSIGDLLSATIQAPMKLNLPKIQDELIIAREIVINDADSSVRQKLTKRQTQEQIQRDTGTVVITRGKYHPPNAPPDNEKLLYLHISAEAHLKDTVQRVLAVDRAAAMIEEMLKSDRKSLAATHAISTSVFLGFDPDPSVDIAARIRGPNEQYINHIMNETGVNVILRGRGSGNTENLRVEEGQEQLHLFLSGNDSKSLETAKHLGENLLDTISVECGVSRVSSSKVCSGVPLPLPQQVYKAVPPPHHNLGTDGLTVTPLPLLSGGTSYSGYYGNIYPQATPLQQVALALRQSVSPPIGSATSAASVIEPKMSLSSNSDMEIRPLQRRKFQEAKSIQVFSLTFYEANMPITDRFVGPLVCMFLRVGGAIEKLLAEALASELKKTDPRHRNVSTMPPPKKVSAPTLTEMPPHPSKFTEMPPPPPEFTSSSLPSVTEQGKNKTRMNRAKVDSFPDTLLKLMEYGDDDDEDDLDENTEKLIGSSSGDVAYRKPFWAL